MKRKGVLKKNTIYFYIFFVAMAVIQTIVSDGFNLIEICKLIVLSIVVFGGIALVEQLYYKLKK
ncbi:hypothetical protein LF864_12810 [Enterococcus faecalis]|uniref:hypothetical protein n=1 Tax=Enterococcus TaxID=1350 RepID=UPI00157424AC|nr:hypothetical protein [Enterococcus faecalis]MCA6712107.1 hypothetical protein [Enterococcus faecalis]MCA6725583.1 hypothetical protein [Enterococcus faecalis]MCA6731131.1 hypothetical protein [Enterococcus faecalis]MCA6751824.1 hypothetical protein [Enterococcus faecalis]MCB5964790.1 hypothetical protein [Enterococcus faecalis]